MNVYDFDGTIFTPDSSYCFICFCLRRYPRAVCNIIPSALFQVFCYLKEGRKDAKKLKESLFSFLNRIESTEQAVSDFWETHFQQIEPWYLEKRCEDDVIISASPEFLLQPVAEKMGVHLIATRMDPYSGTIHGKNCHDAEKVSRFLEQYSADSVDEFYSDSLSDTPMAELARQAYFVKDHQISIWP